MPAPSVVVYKNAYTSSLGAVTTRVLTQITVATGDVVAVVAQAADFSNTPNAVAKTAGTCTIGTVTKNQDAGSSAFCGNVLFTFAVTAGGTLTLTVTYASSINAVGVTAWTYVATGCAGVGNTAKLLASVSTPYTASLTTSVNSYVIAIGTDWTSTGWRGFGCARD